MAYFLKRFFQNIIRLCKWIPIIWNTYDFDYGSSIEVFKFQLSNIANFLESKKAYSTDAKLYAKKIRLAVKLMEKVYNDKYSLEYVKIMETLYGKSKFAFRPSGLENYEEMYVEYDSSYSPEQLKEIDKHESQIIKECNEKQRKAERILWKFINHNIRFWWD